MDNKETESFEEYILEMVRFYRMQDLHINDTDEIDDIRRKDMTYGQLLAFEDILATWSMTGKVENEYLN